MADDVAWHLVASFWHAWYNTIGGRMAQGDDMAWHGSVAFVIGEMKQVEGKKEKGH